MHRSHHVRRSAKVALALILAASTGFAAACGGDGDSDGDPAPSPPPSAAPSKQYTAEELLPALDDLGLIQADKQEDPVAALAGQDSYGAIYTGKYSVQVRITVLGDDAKARSQFDQLAVALRNPPPEFVGSGVAQTDNPAVIPGGLSKGYVTAKPDGNGRLVWTDVSLFGRAIVIVQVLGKDGGDIVYLRTAINERIQAATR